MNDLYMILLKESDLYMIGLQALQLAVGDLWAVGAATISYDKSPWHFSAHMRIQPICELLLTCLYTTTQHVAVGSQKNQTRACKDRERAPANFG
jgi:hypothetical protein